MLRVSFDLRASCTGIVGHVHPDGRALVQGQEDRESESVTFKTATIV